MWSFLLAPSIIIQCHIEFEFKKLKISYIPNAMDFMDQIGLHMITLCRSTSQATNQC